MLEPDTLSVDEDSLNSDERESLELDVNKNETTRKRFKERKLEHKIKKYEAIIKKLEDINRLAESSSQFLFIGNCGLENNVTAAFIEETFSKFGRIIDVIMPKKKPYSFLIYESVDSVKQAIEHLQGRSIAINQTLPYFVLFPVDKVPQISGNIAEFDEIKGLPSGLIYIEDFVDENYSNEICDFILKSDLNLVQDLKNRRVKHFGYEFCCGKNDVKPLSGERSDTRIPEVFRPLVQKLIDQKLIENEPDQLTVNIIESGHGIPPHIDSVDVFDNYIVSVSLLSSAMMEFRLRDAKKLSKLYVKPNSLLVFKGDSRFKWTHSIAERKHDLISAKNDQYLVEKRSKRIVLTFRKVKSLAFDAKNSKEAEQNEPEMKLPTTELEALCFEKSYVHTVYNKIADHFSSTRHSAWPGVAKFVHSMRAYSSMLDVGCGNGKYLNLRSDLYVVNAHNPTFASND